MKKVFALCMAIAGFSIVMNSCTKKYITEQNGTIETASAIYTIAPTQWSFISNDNSYETNLNVPEIDDYLNNHGAVLVFLSVDNQTSWQALPQVYNNLTYYVTFATGTVNVGYANLENSASITVPSATWYFKVVLIDASDLDAQSNVNLKDYNAVKKAFNLKD